MTYVRTSTVRRPLATGIASICPVLSTFDLIVLVKGSVPVQTLAWVRGVCRKLRQGLTLSIKSSTIHEHDITVYSKKALL